MANKEFSDIKLNKIIKIAILGALNQPQANRKLRTFTLGKLAEL